MFLTISELTKVDRQSVHDFVKVCQWHYVFQLSARVCASVRASVPLARCLQNQWMEFHQTLADDVVEATGELIRF